MPMIPDAQQLTSRTKELARHPRTKKIALWIVGIFVAIGVLGALVAPPLLRQLLANQLTAKLHRQVSIEQIRINPYAMSATIRGFLMKERQSAATAISFDELYVNLELQSLFRWGPVIKELRLVKPYINLVRNENRKYNYQDLIEEFMSGPSGPTPRFALKNIEIIDGKIDFDDRPEQTKHAITAINIGVPFISSIPSYVNINVQPHFSAVVNGAPFAIGGETKPFKDSHESTLHLNIDNLQIPKYLEYSPVELNFKVPSGQIDGKLTASVRTSKDQPPVLAISGDVAVQNFIMQESGQAPLLNLPSLAVNIDDLEVFGRKASIKTVRIQGLELHVTRKHDGSLNFDSLIVPGKTPSAPPQTKDEKPFIYSVNDISVDQGKLAFTDEEPEQPFKKQVENIHIDIKGLTNEPNKKAETNLSFQTDAKEQFSQSGTLQLTPLAVESKLDLKNLLLKGLRPYYESVLGVEITEGFLDLAAQLSVAQNKDNQTETKLSDLNASLRSLRLDVPGDSEPLWRAPLLAIKDTTVDLSKKSAVVGSFETRDGNGYIRRDADGTISYARLIKTKPAQSEPAKAQQEETAEWAVQMKHASLERFRVDFEDRMLTSAPRQTVSALSIRAENVSNAANNRSNVRIQATINSKGSVLLAGTLGLRPVAGRFNVELQGVGLVPFQPYLTDQINLSMTSGQVGSKGVLTLDLGATPAKVAYEGGVQVADFASVEKDASEDLLKWKSLDLGGVQFNLEPMQLRINEISLGDFYARLILGADGKLNLQNLAVQKTSTGAAVEAKPANPPPPTAPATSEQKPISIGKINLQNGNINYSDFFIKPNYSANLTSVQGTISELKPETPGDISLDAKLDNAAPVDIRGKINPLSKDLYLDIAANAQEIDLNPMSPYSIKYVGYGIEGGKLTFKVKYKLENRKLDAENQIILNQLTFGEKVESPTATKLPVLLAVALLKDRNGVIDVNLPISGSLDSPEFSVGGIILRIIINIITKAVTSPFALLGAAFGGGSGGELSYIEFDYGSAALSQTAEAKIKSLATAMNNRPALKLDISGRVDPVNDREGLKQTSIERKVKAEKMKELVRQGNAPQSVDDVHVDKAEYERYLKAAYDDEKFAKPRNIIGLAKDLPASEMESLMLKNAQVTDDDLRELANRRAQVVRDRILASGQVTADRLSIVGAKPASAEETDKGKAKMSRVDFALR